MTEPSRGGNAGDVGKVQYLAPVDLIKSADQYANSETGKIPASDNQNIRRLIREATRKYVHL